MKKKIIIIVSELFNTIDAPSFEENYKNLIYFE